ncbi:unnamed protein product [Dracunculus medinensis]|uniref:Peptidase_S8 domain-containing protein n=1 Tax=Dracunculus medinensis TaxID=318479 RepID=A0A0N4U798_DRAME|nr:unnamed protein product [Dracunculus medinensis]
MLKGSESRFLNEWVVEIIGGKKRAQKIAQLNGFYFAGQVRGFNNTYLLKRRANRQKRKTFHKSRKFKKYVKWMERQILLERHKRDFTDKTSFDDPLWPKQWILHDDKTKNQMELIMNITGAWNLGYTGSGIVISIIDDGLEYNHSDLAANYDSKASYDLINNNNDPMPIKNGLNNHGTRCAGEIAMVANNSICGVGIAYRASIGEWTFTKKHSDDRILIVLREKSTHAFRLSESVKAYNGLTEGCK